MLGAKVTAMPTVSPNSRAYWADRRPSFNWLAHSDTCFSRHLNPNDRSQSSAQARTIKFLFHMLSRLPKPDSRSRAR